MRVSRKSVTRVSEGGTHRPEDTSKATGEERDAAQSTPGCDDGARPNPTFGSHAPDGLSEEKNSTPLRKQINLATWNVRSMSTEKLEIVEHGVTSKFLECRSCGGMVRDVSLQIMEMFVCTLAKIVARKGWELVSSSTKQLQNLFWDITL